MSLTTSKFLQPEPSARPSPMNPIGHKHASVDGFTNVSGSKHMASGSLTHGLAEPHSLIACNANSCVIMVMCIRTCIYIYIYIYIYMDMCRMYTYK